MILFFGFYYLFFYFSKRNAIVLIKWVVKNYPIPALVSSHLPQIVPASGSVRVWEDPKHGKRFTLCPVENLITIVA